MVEKLLLLALSCSVSASNLPHYRRETTVIPADSFSSLETYWAYHYPWGTDHNGAARMDEGHVQVKDGTLVLTAEPVEGQPPASHGGNDIQIKYLSGAVHSKDTFSVGEGGGYDFSGEFLAPTERGTWPAFWLNGAETWPPEIDLAEWKGSGDISFNTFNTSSSVTALDVPYPSEGEWHSVTVEIRDVNGADISARFILDGEEVATQYGGDYIRKPLHLIINYQMEGSSGAPGPDTSTTYSIRNVEVVDYNP